MPMFRNLLKGITVAFLVAISWTTISAEIIDPSSVYQSPCKSHTRSENTLLSEITYQNNELSIWVYNLWENCGAELVVECNADIAGELHFIIKDIGEYPMDCTCCFDVECKYTGILQGHYKIYVERYNTVILSTEADIEPGCNIAMDLNGVAPVFNTEGKMLKAANRDLLSVEAEGTTCIEIFDTAGVKYAAMTVDGNTEISLSSLPAGLYLVKATNGNKTENIRIMR